MMQPKLLQSTWPYSNNIELSLDEVEVYGLGMDAHYEFSPPFTSSEDSPDISLNPYFPTMFFEEYMNFPFHVDELEVALPTDDFSLNLEKFEPIWLGEIEDIGGLLEGSEGSFPSQQLSIDGEDEWCVSPASTKSSDSLMDVTLIQPSLLLPTEDMEVDNQLSIIHLLKAYREAMEKEHTQLAEVIMTGISDKVSPVGEIVERLSYYLFQPSDKQADYLKQESGKNFHASFKAFYQIFPYGRFAHFAANSSILEAMPHDAETIHIVDFAMGEGVQWSSMIEAIGQQQKAVRVTSIKWREEDFGCAFPPWRFEETKRWLYDHARSFGVKLKVEEMDLPDLEIGIKKMRNRGGRKEWLAFNCMVGLPHMGRGRSRRHVMEFLRVAKELIANAANCSSGNRGIITFGDGDACDKSKSSSGFGSFFDGYLVHYQALLESMEWNFPIHLAEARTAMECLFVAPYVSSLAWTQKWEEMKEACDLQPGFGLEDWRVSEENLMEAKQIVIEGENLYGVRVEGENKNEMVLEWRGTPLVRVSSWR